MSNLWLLKYVRISLSVVIAADLISKSKQLRLSIHFIIAIIIGKHILVSSLDSDIFFTTFFSNAMLK